MNMIRVKNVNKKIVLTQNQTIIEKKIYYIVNLPSKLQCIHLRKDRGDRKTEKVRTLHGLNDLFYIPSHFQCSREHIPICWG